MTIQDELEQLLLMLTQHQNEWDFAMERHPAWAEQYRRRGTECFRARQHLRRVIELLNEDVTQPNAEIAS